MRQLYRLSALELTKQFKGGSVSCREVVDHFLERIDRHNGRLGAFLSVFHDRARRKAEELDAQRASDTPSLGRLAGIPVALKDNIHVKGELTTRASKSLEHYRAIFDATLTERLEREGAIILGKTNLDEFAMGSTTENSALLTTSNPWNLDCVPGGSSGGSAAAVAARLCPIAFGSDTGGSIRLPAAFCGVVGYKPTYGKVSRYGLVAFASSLDQIGPLAATPQEVALCMEAICGHDPNDATSLAGPREDLLGELTLPVDGKRIGVPRDFIRSLKGELLERFEANLRLLEMLGCRLVDIDLSILQYSIATYYIIAAAEASTNLARYDGIRYGLRSQRAESVHQIYDYSKQEGFGPEVKRRILTGTFVLSSGYQDAYYKQATKVRLKIGQAFERAFEAVDAIAMPMSLNPAFPRGTIQEPIDIYHQDIFTIGANLAYLPAISIPSGLTQSRLPIGLQLIANRGCDRLLLQMAHAFASQGSAPQIPPLFDDMEQTS